MGVDAVLSKKVALQISQNRDNWVNFMMKAELKMEEPAKGQARKSAVTIALSYLAGGFIPLSPYMLTDSNAKGFQFSCNITIFAMFVFGYFKSKFTGQPLLKCTFKVEFICIIAASAAFLLAKAVS